MIVVVRSPLLGFFVFVGVGALACRSRDPAKPPAQGSAIVRPSKTTAAPLVTGVPPSSAARIEAHAPLPAASARGSTQNPRVVAYETPSAKGVHPADIPKQGCAQALSLGRGAASRDDWGQAAAHFVRAVGCDPASAAARGELGNAELRKGNPTGALPILREAEGAAEDTPTRRAIAHNLNKAYELARAPELARRAGLREERLKNPGRTAGGGSACPVVVVRNETAIKQGSWLEAYRQIGFSDAPKPRTAAEARRLCCWSSSAGEAPKLDEGCNERDEWMIASATSAFALDGTFVWRLGEDRAAWSRGYPQGGTFCPLGQSSSASGAEARRVGEFLVIEANTTQYVPDLPAAGGAGADDGATPPCIAVGTTRTLELFDLGLGRGFSLQSLGADVRVELEPERHALRLAGTFCDERVSLAELP
jgi:hypothetical protein